MKIAIYLLRRFFVVFFGAMFFFSFVLILIDLLMNLWSYISNQAPALQVMRVMLLYVPKAVWYSVPFSVLFGCSYTLSAFYVDNELTAIFASGISLFKFTLPVLIFSIMASFGMFFFEDYLVVGTYAEKQSLQNSILNVHSDKDNNNIVVLTESGNLVYLADYYDDNDSRLYNLSLVLRDDDKSLDSIVNASSAVWDEDLAHWRLQNATQYSLREKQISISGVPDNFEERLTEPASTFRNNTVSVEEVNTREAREYIEHLQRTGREFNEELSVYYKKYSFPFIVFIAALLSVLLSGKSRRNVMLISLAMSISATVLFYILQMVTMLLAKFGYISAFSGAWFPVIVFVALSFCLMRFVRT